MSDVQAPELKVIHACGFRDEKEWRGRGAEAVSILKKAGALQGTLVELGASGHLPAALKKEVPQGLTYHGITLLAPVINWGGEAMGNGSFKFSRIDLRDPQRNPTGSVLPEKVRLPFDDESVDTVYAESVFTVMSQLSIRRYFSEISRILKPKGHLVATFFLLNGDTMVRISKRQTKFTFEHRVDTYCRAQDPRNPSAPIAYNDTFIRMLGAPVGLEVKNTQGGAWAAYDGAKSFEDVAVLQKKETPAEEPKKAPAPSEPKK